MVDSQLKPNQIVDQRVAQAMAEVPRELFVPETLAAVAYVDEDLPIAPGRFLMEPIVFARLLQAAAIEPNDIVLDLGCGTGYSTAVLGAPGQRRRCDRARPGLAGPGGNRDGQNRR